MDVEPISKKTIPNSLAMRQTPAYRMRICGRSVEECSYESIACDNCIGFNNPKRYNIGNDVY